MIAQAGFDYCELTAQTVLPFEDDQAALSALRALDAAALRPEAFNVLVPPQLPLVGPVRRPRCPTSLSTASLWPDGHAGRRRVVLGSGGARRIPEGMPREAALDQLADSLSLAADEAVTRRYRVGTWNI